MTTDGLSASSPGDDPTPPSADHSTPPAEMLALPESLRTFGARPPAVLDHRERYSYLAAYDIRDDRRLQKIHKRLLDWGAPVQKSIFECLLTGSAVELMWKAILEIIDIHVDWVVLYRLSRPFHEAVRHVGVYDPGHIHSDTIIFI